VQDNVKLKNARVDKTDNVVEGQGSSHIRQ